MSRSQQPQSQAQSNSSSHSNSHKNAHPAQAHTQQSSPHNLPTISSHLRGYQDANPTSQTRPVAVVIDSQGSRAISPAEDSEEGDSDPSESRSTGRDAAMDDAPSDPDYAPTPAATTAVASIEHPASLAATSVAALVSATATSTPATPISNQAALRNMRGGDGPDEGTGDASGRKHGKRLTTKEEVCLFQICNRHMADFGHRSTLCKWWQTVTDEFTREQGHPYSWHSVRRKVEVVTKQRIKFLDDRAANSGGDTSANDDFSNPQWREAVDAWVPTWRRWEEAEARRIERRDSRRPRKRKEGPWDPWQVSSVTAEGGWRHPSSPVTRTEGTTTTTTTATNTNTNTNTTAPTLSPQHATLSQPSSPSIRLPPGYGSLFGAQSQQPPARPVQYSSSSSSTQPAGPTTDSTVMTAVLETLTRLNKHLDNNPESNSLLSLMQPSEPANTAVQNDTTANTNANENTTTTPQPDLQQLKDEIRREVINQLRREMEQERTALEERLDSVQRTQEMILEMLRQEP
ncbi:hypothetical protein ASPZODRAFT_135613 [Penicilliopsis zonata CBS 506.65]|uniref:Sex determining protein n=1 Tax=Penicilliopsis zonata CBS 506.65 TaxID=1073090 RepID=A0A1L9SAD8_9EURO|nr:hypothetical protein ASPZODRAFT_135613 [Penicilliopsis zonata CBS 506.65]OJJ44134.1 hypothetical protein ASPZODRAFT_135613 [Penicilliopsis zonata CBS 506.65]